MYQKRIDDFISGKSLRATPEELFAVQPFVKILVEDFNYPKEYIQTRPQFRVKKRPSSSPHKGYPVDIAVFNSREKKENQVYIIVECKTPTRDDGVEQLKDYLRFSKAKLGVWFNGDEVVNLHKIERDGYIDFEIIPTLPKYMQRIEDIGQFKRKDLKPTHNLKTVFRTIRNHLAGNAVGTTRDEILAQQLINIIFCKIYDEKYTPQNEIVSFRFGLDEDPKEVENRIFDIFRKVKIAYQEVLSEDDAINLDSDSLLYVVGELQNYCLLDADRDVIADAFEVFIGRALKGSQGQFFTPRNVIQLMIKFLDPKENERIIDPACGSGGFLIEALKHVWKEIDDQGEKLNWPLDITHKAKQNFASKNIFGIDKDSFLSKVAKAYMTLVGDGSSSVVCDDSLETTEKWNNTTRQLIELGTFDVVVTNPPFGKDIAVKGASKLSQFDLAHKWKFNRSSNSWERGSLKDKETPPKLFIDRCLQLLKDGGRLGIVLPETYFHAPTAKYIIDYLMKNNNILAVIDLPHNTFRPNCNAKTIAIVVEKNRPQRTIVMGVAEEMGHDHRGAPIFRYSKKHERFTDKIWDDIGLIIKEFQGGGGTAELYIS